MAPEQVDKLITFGKMALEQGWYDQAREYFEQALALDASNREAMKGLARTNEILSRTEAVAPTGAEIRTGLPYESKAKERSLIQWFKRKSRLGKIGILAGVPLLFLCLCAGLASLISPTPEVTPTPAETVAKAEAPPTTALASTVVSLGEAVLTDECLITIREIKRAELLVWNNQRLKPDGQWVIVYGEARNLTTEEITLHAQNFVLPTPSLEGEIDVHRDATGVAGLNAGVEGTVAGWAGLDIKAGQLAPLVIAFDVPDVVEQATLQIVNVGVGINLGSLKQVAVLPTPAPTDTPIPAEATPTSIPPTPMPTPTSIPQPIATPWLVWLYCPDCAEIGMDVNIWQGPGPDRGSVVAGLPHGTKVEILEETWVAEEGRYWYKVAGEGDEGWVAESFITDMPH